MNNNLIPNIEHSETLPFLSFVRLMQKKGKLQSEKMRSLTNDEIQQLMAQGNSATDWSAVHVHQNFTAEFVRGNQFFNACYLGIFTGRQLLVDNALPLPTGVYNSIISDTVISSNCCIWNTGSIHHYYLADGVILHNNGTITCTPNATFGNGGEIIIGNETGGRLIHSFADMGFDLATAVCRKTCPSDEYMRFILTYTKLLHTGFGIIGTGTRVVNCGRISNSIIGPGAVCNNATLIENSSVMSSSDDPVLITDGAYVRSSCVQPGCNITSMALVDKTVLVEHSHIERHAKVTSSIIGPSTGIAEGEVTASLVGPFVGFHHQALLIGTLWPEGKGNIAYGANIGSNHTGKAPDQELYCGEGLFFGLGSNCKFPADFTKAPYSIIATGCTTLPQRCEFPFSLIIAPEKHPEDMPSGFNEILPGWMLSDNLYALKRNERKFFTRNKSEKTNIPAALFRPETVDMIITARDRLRNISSEKAYYRDTDIQGLGRNFVSRKNILKAISTYTECIEHYCLSIIFNRCLEMMKNETVPTEDNLFTPSSTVTYLNHVQSVISNEPLSVFPLKRLIERFVELTEKTVQAVVFSKKKDDLRGIRIMPDYHVSHSEVSSDPLVKALMDENRQIKKQAKLLATYCTSE